MTATDRERALERLWGDSAESYDEHTRRFWTHRRITILLAASITAAPRRILDFGCGPGNSTRLLRTLFPDAEEIIGIDTAQPMVDRASAEPVAGVSYLCSDAAGLVAQGVAPFDLIVCSNSFFHVEDKRRNLADFRALLTPRGQIAFSMYDFLFLPADPPRWPYARKATDHLMSDLLEAVRARGYDIDERKEDREVFDEAALEELLAGQSFRLRFGGALRLGRTPMERLSFFRIPAVAQEVFPDVPHDVIDSVIAAFPPPPEDTPVQERTVYAFVASL